MAEGEPVVREAMPPQPPACGSMAQGGAVAGGGISHMSLSRQGCQGSCCGLILPLLVLFCRGVLFKS